MAYAPNLHRVPYHIIAGAPAKTDLPIIFIGLSTHVKPSTSVLIGSIFIETDTAQIYIFNDSSSWQTQTAQATPALGSITNAYINAAAAIAYSKLNLASSIVNADVHPSAAIAYSKLNLGNSIMNADVNTSAAIAYSKLNLASSIMNTDVNASAAIAKSKLAPLAIADADIAAHTSTKITIANKLLLPSTAAYEDEANSFTVGQSFSSYLDLVRILAPADPATNVGRFYLKQVDANNDGVFVKLKKTGAIVEEQLGAGGGGGWDPNAVELLTNKTINVNSNTIRHSTTNALGDILKSDGVRMTRLARGTANQVLTSDGTDIAWAAPASGGGLSSGGTATFSGTGSQTTFTIPHGLTTTQPELYFVLPTSDDAVGHFKLTLSSTDITITYAVAPITGSSNLTFIWGAGYVSEAVQGFTPGSTTTLTNKTIGDTLGFTKQGSTPTNPALEGAILYTKAIDANNNGLFMKIKKANAIVEVQLL